MVLEIAFGLTYLLGLRPMYRVFEDFAEKTFEATELRIPQYAVYAMTAVWPITEAVFTVVELFDNEETSHDR